MGCIPSEEQRTVLHTVFRSIDIAQLIANVLDMPKANTKTVMSAKGHLAAQDACPVSPGQHQGCGLGVNPYMLNAMSAGPPWWSATVAETSDLV
ncbi:hypothetical protein PR003_g17485 [Phytophthora rubi]|uniref:Uncharacterized protein n=1 Tax=Phytophthora rubi TaxID=129364 RepID=A0A6A3H699_9STRA|nr:hypothetical protein PR002_g29845 [Phytophthora rubi]KAE8964667.1 hypothetical protein PR001_g28982 [Phytophthora rubi]KAE9321418.1 hypothetical protein PR003_g17485 [Phytophthora rubi]